MTPRATTAPGPLPPDGGPPSGPRRRTSRASDVPRPREPRPGPTPPGRGSGPWLLPLLLGLAGLLVVAWWSARAPGPAPPEEPGVAELVAAPVGVPLTAPLGDDEVVLEIVAEVARRDPGPSDSLDALPAGAPAVLTITIPPTAAHDGSIPDVVARSRTEGAVPSPTRAGTATEPAPHDHAEDTPTEHPHPTAADDLGGVPVSRPETFLLNQSEGTLVVPNRAGGAPDDHADGHDHAPGQGLAQTIPGGGWAWAAKVTPDPATVELAPTGRWLALSHPTAGMVELVDLVKREQAVQLDVGGEPQELQFSPDGRALWIGLAGGGLHVFGMDGRKELGQRPDLDVDQIVFDATGDHAMLLTDGPPTATLVDTTDLTTTGSHRLETARTDVTFASDPAAFVLADGRSTVTLLPLEASELGIPHAIELTDRASSLAVDPDGRTAVAVHPDGDVATVIDLQARAVVGRAATGRDPQQVAFLERFAVLRSAGSADVTWIDLDDPSSSNVLPLQAQPATNLTVSADGQEILASSPAEQRLYRIHQMMGRPMVMEHESDPSAADVAIVGGGGVVELDDGVYQVRTSFEQPGIYEVTVQLSADAVTFTVPVAPTAAGGGVTARPVVRQQESSVGEQVRVRFVVEGGDLGSPEVAGYATGPDGPRQLRAPALRVGEGIFEAVLTPGAPGAYDVWLLDEAAGLGQSAASTMRLEVTGSE
jgi:DNA-binding beta-propeller fold protein YncE